MKRLLTVLGAVLVVWVPSPAAVAHGDGRLVGAPLDIEPGASVEFEGLIHYHRLVGRFRSSQPISVELVEAEGGESVLSLGPGRDLGVNRLVRCCADRVWTPYRLVIENRGTDTARVEAQAALVHDDLAVMVYRAEAGTAESVVILGFIWAWVVRRVHRRGKETSALRAAATVGLVVGVVSILGGLGAIRYGTAGAPALVAGLADVPLLPVNPVVARASALLGVLMVGWGIAGAQWIRARGSMGRSAWLGMGGALIGLVTAVAILVGVAYTTFVMPAAMAGVAAVPLAVVMFRPDASAGGGG